MEDRAYGNATRRRKELQAEIDEIDRFLVQWKRYAGTEPEHDITPGVAQLSLTTTAPRVKLNRKNRVEFLRGILVEAGRPMTRSQIVAALDERDVAVGGTVVVNDNCATPRLMTWVSVRATANASRPDAASAN